MNHRSRHFGLVAVMFVVSALVTGSTIFLFYHVALQATHTRLSENVRAQVQLVEAVAKFDEQFSANDHPDGATGATLDQLLDAHRQGTTLDTSGEFTVARQVNGRIVFMFSSHDMTIPPPEVAMSGELAAPMREALSGQSGTMIGLDYQGEQVVAAYEPIPQLKLGMVVKIPLAEIRAPYLRAGLIAAVITIVLASAGAFVFQLTCEPVFRTMEEQQATLQAVLATAVDGIVIIDDRGTVQSFNQACERLFGYAANDVIGQNVSMLMPSPDRENHDQYIHNYMTTKKAKIIGIGREVCGQRADGSTFPLDLAISEVNVDNRRLFAGILRDLTERKAAEEQLKASEKQFRELAEKVRILPWVADLQTWQFSYVGPQCESILGFDEATWYTPEFWQNHIHPSDREWVTAACSAKALNGEHFEFEYRMLNKNGDVVWLQHLININTDDDGEQSIQGYFIDTSERRKSEEELKKAQDELTVKTTFAERLSALAAMAGGIAHELNQPLSGIRMYAETVVNLISRPSATSQEQVQNTMKKIMGQVDRSSAIIEHMRDFASEGDDVALEVISAQQVLTRALELIGAQLRNHGIELIDKTSSEHEFEANPHRMEQVLINLLSNARDSIDDKAVASGEPKSITVESLACNGRVRIRIQDTGGGVPTAVRERLFEPFVTSKGPARGTGLGLAICHGILRDYGGHIQLLHTDNSGTTFELDLPNAGIEHE